MVSIKTLYFDVGNAVKGICTKTYPRSRPKAVKDRPDSYIVVSFPSSIFNEEMNDVKDKTSANNLNTFDIYSVDEKVDAVMEKFPISTENIKVTNPRITLQSDDGDGFSVTIIQGQLRTK